MAIKSAVILVVLVCVGTNRLIDAEIIRGMDIPRLNITRLAGMWQMVAAYEEQQQLKCSTSVLQPQSDDAYMLNLTYSFTSDAKKNNPNLPDGDTTESVTATMVKDSNVMQAKNSNNEEVFWAMFDVDYDSHCAIYGAKTMEQIKNGTDGYIFVVSRHQTLKDEIVERIKASSFYKEGLKPGLNLVYMNISECV